MNKERLYKHNGYGFGYDSDFKDGSCLTIVKSKKDTLEVLTHDVQYFADAVKDIKDLQQELDKYKNIADELEKGFFDIRQLTFSKYNSNEWNNCLSFNDDIKPLLDKLQKLKGE